MKAKEIEIKSSISQKKRKMINYKLAIENEQERANEILKILENVRDKKILDIGCGVGVCIKNLKERGAKTIGLDINIIGKKIFPGLDIRKFDLNSQLPLPFKNKSFDIVICTEVLEHIFYSHFIMKEIKRV